MLIEIFNDKIHEQLANSSEKSGAFVPYTVIAESEDSIRAKYNVVRNFLISAIDSNIFNLKNGGHYILEIEHCGGGEYALNSTDPTPYKFNFKFDYLGNTSYKKKTIHGEVQLNSYNEIIKFDQDSNHAPIVSTGTSTIVYTRDPYPCGSGSTSSTPVQKRLDNATNYPFVQGGQQNDNTALADRQEKSAEDGKTPIVELSPNSFNVSDRTINVQEPSLEIGTVKDTSFTIDTERQARQDEFLKNINAKFANRRKQ